ncbi:hypothetical protein P7M31_16105 [Vibrio parahaemolyticus]|nr:hypothetical protein [Vibrio parahaemolyticus]
MIRFTTISDDTKYWFVRAGNNGGKYFYHFKDNDVVALGHANIAELNFDEQHELNGDDKAAIIGSVRNALNHSGESPSQISNKTNQLNRFLNEMNIGDIVISINDTSMMAGIVTSDTYYSSVALAPSDSTSNVHCEFLLRCNVRWGRVKPRGLMPTELEKAFRFTGSVMQFSLEEQIKALNHWLYPVHMTEEEVCCTLRINSREDLSNHQLTRLSKFLDDLELVTAYFETSFSESAELSLEELLQFIDMNRADFSYTLKAQHLFMSPGHQFIQLPGSNNRKYLYAALLNLLLSNETLAFENLPSGFEQINNAPVQQIMRSYREHSEIASLQESLRVDLSQPSLPNNVTPNHSNNGQESGVVQGDGWGTSSSDNTAL